MSSRWSDSQGAIPSPETPDLRVLSAGTVRSVGLLDSPLGTPLPDPKIEDLVAIIQAEESLSGCLLSGGEPTLRADLPTLLEALSDVGVPRLGLYTDGLALTSEKTLNHLRDCGLQRLRIPLHSARADAHDWLVGLEGAAKRALKAIRLAASAGIEVEVETIVTRPTTPHLEELAQLLARLRVEAIHFRRLTARGGSTGSSFVTTSPRFGLTQASLEAAVRAADSWGVRPAIHYFPSCAIAGTTKFITPIGAEKWVATADPAWQEMLSLFASPSAEKPCEQCPGAPQCEGPPGDYLSRFGRLEIDSQSVVDVGDEAPSDEEKIWAEQRLSNTPPNPPTRRGRTPATRPSFIWHQVQRELFGDPMSGMQKKPDVPCVGISFRGPSRVEDAVTGDPGPTEFESSRDLRIQMVRLAQEGATCIRIASAASLAHPEAPELLRDAIRLSFTDVEICGEGSALADFEDVALRRLRRKITRLDVALYGPDAKRHDEYMKREGAFDETLNGVERLQSFARLKPGAYAILHDAKWLADYAQAWEDDELIGEPAFRLSERGGSLDELAAFAKDIGPGSCFNALARVLPACLLEREEELEPSPSWETLYGETISRPEHSGSDRIGRFAPCPQSGNCGAKGKCPGIAIGWKSEMVSPVMKEGAS